MAKTVLAAFNEFLKEKVNLDSAETKLARKSRDWLVSQIHTFPGKDNDFPRLYSERDIFFGSFARHTKNRELDDIDVMITLSAEGGYYYEFSDRIEITVTEHATQLKKICHDGTNILNSRKVINRFISILTEIPQYEKAEIKRNLEAVTLKLTTYKWNFDIVPSFFTKVDSQGRDYYLIPDGKGHWKKTDPRLDRERVKNVNSTHDGNVLNVIRIMKYWNKRPTMPSMSSYLIENMILDYYENGFSIATKYVDLEIPKILDYIKSNIFSSVNDPKKIQGNINNLATTEQIKIFIRAKLDSQKAIEARQFESNNNHRSSINKWREIFGSDFPKYE